MRGLALLFYIPSIYLSLHLDSGLRLSDEVELRAQRLVGDGGSGVGVEVENVVPKLHGRTRSAPEGLATVGILVTAAGPRTTLEFAAATTITFVTSHIISFSDSLVKG